MWARRARGRACAAMRSATALSFRSASNNIVWPALPELFGAAMLALQYQFEESEWWPAETMLERQFEQLRKLLGHCATRIPFYAERLARAGVRDLAEIDLESWRRIPILTREDVRAQGAALVAPRDPDGHGQRRPFATTGSTGTPIRGVQTQLTDLYWEAVTLRDHLWHGRDLKARLAVIRYPMNDAQTAPQGVRAHAWNQGVAAAFANGPSRMLDVNRPVPDLLDWLLAESSEYLLVYPSVLRELLRESHRRRAAPRGLRGVITFAEQMPPGLREQAARQWGARVQDIYSTTETGYMALQCPERPHYHLQSEVCFIEILGDDGRPCGPGEIGRIVATPLHNYAMPLLRYAVGDLAEVGMPCACGRGLPVLRRILGRVRNMLRRPDGTTIWPDVTALFEETEHPIRQFQVVQTSAARLEVRLVCDPPLTQAAEEHYRAQLRANCGFDVEVGFRYVPAIARGPGGKYEDFRSEIAAHA